MSKKRTGKRPQKCAFPRYPPDDDYKNDALERNCRCYDN